MKKLKRLLDKLHARYAKRKEALRLGHRLLEAQMSKPGLWCCIQSLLRQNNL